MKNNLLSVFLIIILDIFAFLVSANESCHLNPNNKQVYSKTLKHEGLAFTTRVC